MKHSMGATLLGNWWRSYFRSIRYCFACGQLLRRHYVPEEGCRRHVCFRCGKITYLNPKVVAGFIPLTSRGEVVLLKRNIEPGLGKWTFPAGFQELGETVEEAALRETREEVGIKARLKGLVGLYSYRDAGVVTVVYHGIVPSKARFRAGGEAAEIKAFKMKDIPWTALAFRSTREALRAFPKKGSKDRQKR